MDIDQIKTFLAVVETGSFMGAADQVHVTQSTVSIRIRALENSLNSTLFDRGKRGASLTPSGQQFLGNATAIMRLWNQSRLDVGKSRQQDAVLRVGAQHSLWDGYLVAWLGWMRAQAPQVALRGEIGAPTQLMQGLVDGSLDLCVLYRPQHRPGFIAEQIFEEDILLVTSQDGPHDWFSDRYVLTYWGPDFQAYHALHFPSIDMPYLSLDLGPLALDHVVQSGGAGYFPRRFVAPYLQSGQLFEAKGAPVFKYPAYAVWPQTLEPSLKRVALEGLRACLNVPGEASLQMAQRGVR